MSQFCDERAASSLTPVNYYSRLFYADRTFRCVSAQVITSLKRLKTTILCIETEIEKNIHNTLIAAE